MEKWHCPKMILQKPNTRKVNLGVNWSPNMTYHRRLMNLNIVSLYMCNKNLFMNRIIKKNYI